MDGSVARRAAKPHSGDAARTAEAEAAAEEAKAAQRRRRRLRQRLRKVFKENPTPRDAALQPAAETYDGGHRAVVDGTAACARNQAEGTSGRTRRGE